MAQHMRPIGPITNNQAPFFPDMAQGYQPAQPRILLGNQRGRTMAQTTHDQAAFGPEMTAGWHSDVARITLGARIPLPILPPTIDAFSIEMVIGSQPQFGRQLLGIRIPLPLSQTTHVQAPIGPEMLAGWHSDSARIRLGPRIPLPILPPTIDLFSVDMVIGSRPERARILLGNQRGQSLSQTTHVNAPFGPEMVIGWRPERQRGFLPLRTGWWVWIEDIPQAILVADACNTFMIAADAALTVGAEDTGFSVVAEDQSFDVEGCE